MKNGRYYIYGLFEGSRPDTITYIGCSGSLMDRFETHVGAHDGTTKDWVGEVRSRSGVVRMVVLESQPNKQAGLEREKFWIRLIRPFLNTICRDIQLEILDESLK